MMRGLLAAIGFLTRVPVPVRVFADARAQSQSLAWYPAVGLLLGGLLCALAWVLQALPPLPGSALLVAAWVLLTGALHLDGLADSADAWVGGLGDRTRTLAIMKDPACGPAGVVALVLVLLLKVTALASLPGAPWAALLLAPLIARMALTAAFVTTPYVRSGGLGSGLADASRRACAAGLLLGATAACMAYGWRGVLALGVAGLVFAWWRHACMQRLG
ncbi:MAG: adenosylcobinamide-GDP ribazoletransferase, partial [Lysobacter sp.]